MKKIINTLVMAMLCTCAFAQVPRLNRKVDVNVDLSSRTILPSSSQSKDTTLRTDFLDNATIYFRLNKDEIDPTYLTNAQTLATIHSRLSDSISLAHLDSVSLNASASPEGKVEYNKRLSERRAAKLREYLLSRYPQAASKLHVGASGEDWDGFVERITTDSLIPHKAQLLSILDSDLSQDGKEWRMKQLSGGVAWRYITNNILPYLRTGASAIFHYDLVFIQMVQEPQIELLAELDAQIAQRAIEIEVPPLQINLLEMPLETKPLFAVKTNLLFDAASVLNIELEVPLGSRMSFAGEWIFPWWLWDNGEPDSKQHALEVLSGNIELKYWFGDRTNRPVMTGWYAGLYAGGGLYDLEWNREGYQGEFFIATGLSVGYAHTINKTGSLCMEYSVGVGYLSTDYRYYQAEYEPDGNWHLYRELNGSYSWMGPTRARVSLVWLLSKQRRARR